MVAPGQSTAQGQGLPQAAPQLGFLPGPNTNQFGSWGAPVESAALGQGGGHGIPGDTGGLTPVGNAPTQFNPGDQVPKAAPLPPNAPRTVAPPPAKITPPAAITSTSTNTSTPSSPIPTFGSITPPPPQEKTYNAPGGSAGGTEAQWNAGGYRIVNGVPYRSNSPILAKGGAIPAMAEGGEVGSSGAEDRMGGVRQAVSMARSQFGLSDAAFQGMSQHFSGGQSAGGQQAPSGGGAQEYAGGGSVKQVRPGMYQEDFKPDPAPIQNNNDFHPGDEKGIDIKDMAPNGGGE